MYELYSITRVEIFSIFDFFVALCFCFFCPFEFLDSMSLIFWNLNFADFSFEIYRLNFIFHPILINNFNYL